MRPRRYGLMRPGGATRIVAAVLVAGLIGTTAFTYLAQAGFTMLGIVLVVGLLIGVPVLLFARSGQ